MRSRRWCRGATNCPEEMPRAVSTERSTKSTRSPQRPKSTEQPTARFAEDARNDLPSSSAQRSAELTVLAAEPPASAASSAPLRLDRQTLGRAAQAARGTVFEMMTRSDYDSGKPSAGERLAQSIAKAGIPDCLRPDASSNMPIQAGGLGLPILATAAATGACK